VRWMSLRSPRAAYTGLERPGGCGVGSWTTAAKVPRGTFAATGVRRGWPRPCPERSALAKLSHAPVKP